MSAHSVKPGAKLPVRLIASRAGQKAQEHDGRSAMRTVADALAKLESLGALSPTDGVRIETILMELPDGRVAGAVRAHVVKDAPAWCVILPISSRFMARDASGTRRAYPIAELDGAVSDADGRVRLLDGSHVRAVELEPVKLTHELTEEHERIVRSAIRVLGAEDRCYRSLHESLPKVLDYAAVAGLGRGKLPSLKWLEREIEKLLPGLSRQTVANVLTKAGLRRPRSGARARPKAPRAMKLP